MTSEFDLVCDRAYLRPTYQTAYMIGNLIGAPMGGILSDRFGRKTIIMGTTLIGLFSVLISLAFRSVEWIIVARFVSGTTFHSMLLTSFTLFMEVCEPKHRSTAGILYSVPWAFGTMWWGCLGYLIRGWRWLLAASIAPSVIILFCLCFYDESPRWLIVKGKHEEALRALKKASRWNGASLPSDDQLMLSMLTIQETSISKKSGSETQTLTCWKKTKNTLNRLIILMKTQELRRITLLMYLLFFVAGNVYYGMYLNAVNFGFNRYLYMVLIGLTEIPAYVVTGYAIKKFGRIRPTVATFMVSGITILILAFLPTDRKSIVFTIAAVGTTCIAAAFQIVFLAATEVFPTEVRMQGFGTSSFMSSVGGGIAPYITDSLGQIYPWMPSMIFGALSSVAGITASFVPETLNRHLPETVEQLEDRARKNENRRLLAHRPECI